MKWLLVSTVRNPGDGFIRRGVQKVIRAVDPHAEIEVVDKESPTDWIKERPFDKAVLCGMPLFWNNPVGKSQDIGWWGIVQDSWISARKKDFLIMGAGHCYGSAITNLPEYAAAIQTAIDRAWRVTTRSPVMSHPQLIDSVCPASFNLIDREYPQAGELYCNLMPHGGDPHFDEPEAEVWRGMVKDLSKMLLDNGFKFIAHCGSGGKFTHDSWNEHDFAISLGWPEDRIFTHPDSAEEFAKVYANGRFYIGNRVHGAAILCGGGSHAIQIGYDSRSLLVSRLGGTCIKPYVAREWMLNRKLLNLTDILGKTMNNHGLHLARYEFNHMVDLTRKFANQ